MNTLTIMANQNIEIGIAGTELQKNEPRVQRDILVTLFNIQVEKFWCLQSVLISMTGKD
jgi:hypothetical protein